MNKKKADLDTVEFEDFGDYDELDDVVEYEDLPELSTTVTVPGSDFDINELSDNLVVEEDEVETTWESDRDPTKFMDWLISAYPTGIPRHDGKSIAGAEKAINYLNSVNKQISEAIRLDSDGELDVSILDGIRESIIKDMMTLKEHIKKLQKQIRDGHKVAADSKDLTKVAANSAPTYTMTPFERALIGIVVNAVITAGHPFEDVFEFLKEKYNLSPREELSLFQLARDHGMQLYKDRGMVSEDETDEDSEKRGVDFAKNYFA